jgi:hypothetical protein
VLLLLPVDVVVAGSGAFTSAPLGDSIVTAWVALSLAMATTLALWSAWLFLRGLEAATHMRLRRALVVGLGAAICLSVVVGTFAAAGNLAITGSTT